MGGYLSGGVTCSRGKISSYFGVSFHKVPLGNSISETSILSKQEELMALFGGLKGATEELRELFHFLANLFLQNQRWHPDG